VRVSKRQIVTTYWAANGAKRLENVKQNRAIHIRSAIMRALDHLASDEYSASVCEIWHNRTGILIAAMRRTPRRVEVMYKRDPRGIE
jgi:hypothetical protein